jgi:hypothetical protein
MLRNASRQVGASLKNNGHYTVILHDTDQGFLERCVNSVEEAGFVPVAEDIIEGYNVYTFKKASAHAASARPILQNSRVLVGK